MIRIVRYTSPLRNVDSYIAFDTETTGLNSDFDKIVEVGMVEIHNGEIVDQYSSLVNPGFHIPARASEINHIYDNDVAEAPGYGQIAPVLAKWLIGKTVIAHNAPFDMKFIQRLLENNGYSGTIKYIDTVYYARSVVGDVENYKLQTLADHFDIDTGNAHRALDDALTCHHIFQACKKLSPDGAIRQESSGRDNPAWISAKEIVPSRPASPVSPLYGKIVVFTGELSISKRAAMQMAVDAGATVKDNLTLSTDYLVEGEQNPDYVKDDGLSNKQRKAREINNAGKGKINIIGEAEFMHLCESEAKVSAPLPAEAGIQSRNASKTNHSAIIANYPLLSSTWAVVQWAFAIIAFFFSISLVSSDTSTAAVFFLIALISAPIKPLRDILSKVHIRGAVIAAIIAFLFIVALFI